MDSSTIKKIININREFYQTFAQPFAQTRQRLQPGVKQILKTIGAGQTILDIGCGNGELARELYKTGFRGKYVGVDFSSNLLEAAAPDKNNPRFVESKQQAEKLLESSVNEGVFLQADLSAENWDSIIPNPPYDIVFCFAVLHHIPGETLRLQILSKIQKLLRPGGYFWHSEWQFLNSPRLVARIQPWEKVNLNANQLDPGDYLLDWRQGGTGYRYVHHFDAPELSRLAELSGFSVCETFFSDGKGNRLAIYQKWQNIQRIKHA
jgi:SAM-dependent methyltransferase